MNERRSTHWSNPFALEEINFQPNRTESWHDTMLNFCAAAQLDFSYRNKRCRDMVLVYFTVSRHDRVKIVTSSFFTQKWVFKRKETKMAKGSDFLETCKLVGVLGFEILRRLKQRLELWKRFGAPTIWFSSSSSSFPFSCHLWLYIHHVFVLLHWLWVAKLFI